MADATANTEAKPGTSFFKLFIEVFSIVAALLLFTSAYIQYRLFAALDIPFFLVASSEDILLGGFSILATTLDQFLRLGFWLALPAHLILLAGILAAAWAICELCGWTRWWRQMAVVVLLTGLLLAARSWLAGSFALQGDAGAFENFVRAGLGPVDANGPLGLWSYLARLVTWTAIIAVPVALSLWLVKRRRGSAPHWREGVRFARNLGSVWLVALFLVVAAGSIPRAIYQSFSWGKGKVTEATPAAVIESCEGGDVFVVWSGAKSEVMRCFNAEGERDFVVLRGEHTVVEMERQNVRGDTLTPIEP